MNSLDQNLGGLAAGTLVTTPDGDKKIEEIKAGDLVLSGVGEDETNFFKVSKANAKQYRGPILRITANRHNNIQYQIRATPNHVCFGNSFKGLRGVSENAILLYAFNYSGEETGPVIHSVSRRNNDDDPEDFDSLEGAEKAARQMAQSDGGVDIGRFACFNYYPIYDFMTAADLAVDMEIPTVKDKGVSDATITSITEEQYDGLVYDLDIPEARNFAANGVLVHDSTRVL